MTNEEQTKEEDKKITEIVEQFIQDVDFELNDLQDTVWTIYKGQIIDTFSREELKVITENMISKSTELFKEKIYKYCKRENINSVEDIEKQYKTHLEQKDEMESLLF